MVLQISALLEETAAWAVVALLTLVMLGRRGAGPAKPAGGLQAPGQDPA